MDILLGTSDLASKNGDFALGLPDQQNVELLLRLNEGDLKSSPVSGIGLLRFYDAPMSSSNKASFIKKVSLQIINDGGEVPLVDVSGQGDITIKTNYL